MIRFRAFAAPDLRSDESTELRGVLAQPKRFAVFAYLALATPRGYHRRDKLVALFWPEFDQEHARNALRQAIHYLRQSLGPGVVVNRGSEEVGIERDRVWCDAAAFDEALESKDLAGALALYRGDLLPGFFVSDAPEFDRWLESERSRLRARASTAAWDLADRETAQNNGAAASHWARWAAALAPDNEAAHRRLIELLIKLGDRGGAARAYQDLTRRLAEEYEVEPAPETKALAAVLQQSSRAPSTRSARSSPAPMRATPAHVPEARVPAQPTPAAPKSKRRGWRQSATPLVIAVGVALGALLLRSRRPAPEMAVVPHPGVTILPFSVRGGAELAYLGKGMVNLLSAKLEGVPGFQSADPRAVLAAVPDSGTINPSAAREIARRLGTERFVVGDVVEIAGRLQLSAAMYDRSNGQPLTRASVEGDAPQLFELVDGLAGQLLAGQRPGRDTALTRLAAVTTSSLPALKAFLEGEREFAAGRHSQAVAAFKDAIAQDSSFALAYYRLALAVRWIPFTDIDGPTAVALARRHETRLSPLARDLIKGYQTYLRVQGDSAEQTYRILTQAHPDNVEAWFMLGETLFHTSPWFARSAAESRQPFERVLALDPRDLHAALHLARLAAAERRWDDFDGLTQSALASRPDAERALELGAIRAFGRGDSAEQDQVIVELRQANDAVLDAALQGALASSLNPAGAARMAPLFGRPNVIPQWRSRARLLLSQIGLAQGMRLKPTPQPDVLVAFDPDWPMELHAALAAIAVVPVPRRELLALRDSLTGWTAHRADRASMFRYHEDWQPQMRSYMLGLLNVRLGDTASAERHASELDRLAAHDNGLAKVLAHLVRGDLAWSRGDQDAAAAQLDSVPRNPPYAIMGGMTPHVGGFSRFLRAQVSEAQGRLVEAIAWYASFPTSNGIDLIYLAPGHLRQAEIYQRLGQRERAIEHYSRFAELWRNCDPDLRGLVIKAEQEIERLKAGAN